MVVAELLVWSRGAAAAMLEIDHQKSKIEIAVVSTVHDFVGEFVEYETSIDCNPEENLPAKVDVTFDFKDLKTGVNGRDTEMLKWLKYSSNPKATFHLTNWKQAGAGSIALGELTMHGVKNAIQIPTVIKHAGGNYEITGAVGLDYRDFKLPIIRKALLFSVDPHLMVKFHLTGKLPVR